MSESVRLADQQAARVVVDGCAVVDGEVWTVVRTPAEIEEAMRAAGVPKTANRGRVLAALQIKGCWPVGAALRDYLKGCK